ncbi:MAG: 3'-5' exonuclease [Gammaproteobacteria bacterium]|nr:3'-5' exonuclease [Gammaproteobacteria bacterium]MCZ6911987.1 3'-5' exonuclease [Pseudomonadota bacterium]
MLDCMVFDIETVPDIDLGRRLFNLDGLGDEEIAQAMFHRQVEKTGSEFLPLHQHRVAAISVALRNRSGFRVWSLGEEDSGEKDIITRFFDGIERFTPTIVSWNGGGFDLPVLHYRSLLHGVSAPRYWETGDDDQSFRWNNYQSRFHWRHTDLMDVISGYQPRGRAPLQDIALLLGFPGKLGMSGEQVWPFFVDGQIAKIRNYCETDVLNTYLIYLQFQTIRGRMDADQLAKEYALIEKELAESGHAHLTEFLTAWKTSGSHS